MLQPTPTWIPTSARHLPLSDESVQCVVTSPPYWGLRAYEGNQEEIWGGDPNCEHAWGAERKVNQSPQRDHDGNGWANTRGEESARKGMSYEATQGNFCEKCCAWRGDYGLEPRVEMYIAHSLEILREIRRVLKKDGVVFWNVGDSYSGGNWRTYCRVAGTKQADNKGAIGGTAQLVSFHKNRKSSACLRPKNLCLIPERVAIAAQEDGWWLRSIIIWAKPNPMPESVKDRLTDSYEHILMLTKSPKYYWDWEASQEDAITGGKRTMRNVWSFPVGSGSGAHFATFPEELPRRCIRLASRPGDTVLDPFAGSGTTGKVAVELGRIPILCDIAYAPGGYLDIAKARVATAGQEKTPKKPKKAELVIGCVAQSEKVSDPRGGKCMRKTDSCMNCGETREIAAHGLCFKCYRRDERADDNRFSMIGTERQRRRLIQDRKKLLSKITSMLNSLADVEGMLAYDDVTSIRTTLQPYLHNFADGLTEVNSEQSPSVNRSHDKAEVREPANVRAMPPVNGDNEQYSEQFTERGR
jgi:site-specific DNA-methyltransferase (cytosine-N4-specific)